MFPVIWRESVETDKEMAYQLLSKINTPEDLRTLPLEQLPEVCKELREDIIHELSSHPGHFASSLGTVELTVALHYVYNTPYDRLVWDVGHQAYGHKILTGRRDSFHTNRQYGGIRPFPSPFESEYDTFTCGHASNSISAALGMAVAARLKGETDRHVIAVLGDGSMSGGLAFEGLNNASSTPNDMLIVLNDNNMSIDHSVGGMQQYLLDLNTNPQYNRLRLFLSRKLTGIGLLTDARRKSIIRFNNSLKSLLSQQQNLFEGMNIRYFGPADGHNVIALVKTLREIKEMKGPKLLHLHTVKGKGFEPAEKNATLWHAPGRFNPDTGERLVESDKGIPPKFQDVFGATLLELARKNPAIVGITPAMPTGSSLNLMMKEMPERTFDVGIAEGHAVTFAGGLAKDGMCPFCVVYSSFLQRAYDNIIHDVALPDLNVVFCIDRAGLVGEDGPTHHGVFDMAFLRSIPNLTVAAPLNAVELRDMMYTAQLKGRGPFAIRYPRGRDYLTEWKTEPQEIPVGKGRRLKEGEDLAVVSIGAIGKEAMDAIQTVESAHPGWTIAHYDLRFLKPLDEALLRQIGNRFRRIITVEDGILAGGMGSALLEFYAEGGIPVRLTRLGVKDQFVEHGDVKLLRKLCGYDSEGIAKAICAAMEDGKL